MLLHVVFRQLDSDGETLDDEYDAREFESNLIGVAPCSRVDQVRSVRAKDDTADCGDRCFSYVEALLDEGGTEHEE